MTQWRRYTSFRNIWSHRGVLFVTILLPSIFNSFVTSKEIVTDLFKPGVTRENYDHHMSGSPMDGVYKIQMPDVTTDTDDVYQCIDWVPLSHGKHFITGFEAVPDDRNVHHILLFACSGQHISVTQAGDYPHCHSIYFAWGRNAPPTNLPKDVGFVIGGDGKDFLRLQVHYKTAVSSPDKTKLLLTITSEPQAYTAGVLLLESSNIVIPSHSKQVIGNVSCQYTGSSVLHPFAFRTHAHMLGRVISGYVKHGSNWTKIGKGNPNWPQAFWPVTDKGIEIRHGDYLAGKCVYSSENHAMDVRIGSTHNDEMCNFYIMHYYLSGEKDGIERCSNDQYPEISRDVPAEAIEPLPPNPELDALGEGHGHSHHHHMAGADITSSPAVNGWTNLLDDLEFGQLAGMVSKKYKLAIIFIVVLCLFVLTLTTIVGITIYIKNRRRTLLGYSHLEAAQENSRRFNDKMTGGVVKAFVSGSRSLPDSVREDELKRLESESEEEFSVPNIKSRQI